MKLPLFKRLRKDDYPEEQQTIIESIAFSINTAVEGIISALNKNVSIRDNILCTTKDVDVTVDSAGIPSPEVSVSIDFTGNVYGIQVLKVDNLTNSAGYPTSGVTVSFNQTPKGIQITHITGLSTNNKYRIRLVMYG
jgi:hypothetical protein